LIVAQRVTASPVGGTLGWLTLAIVGLSLPALANDITTRSLIAALVMTVFTVVTWCVARRTMHSRAFGL
jgi:FtsH-binding integral membrane protein